jgi:PAS domain S-box-containing protein
MKKFLKQLLAPHHLEYIALNRDLLVLETSSEVNQFAENCSAVELGNHICDAFPELMGMEELLIEILDGNIPNFELKSITRVQHDGTYLYFDLYVIPYQEDKDNSGNLVIFLEDVTDRMGLEQTLVQATNETNLLVRKLETTKNYIEKIISSMAEALIVTNTKGKIKSVNHSVEVLFGYSESELVGKDISLLIADENFCHRVERYFSVSEGEPLSDVEVNCCTKSGIWIMVSFSCSLIETDISQQNEGNFSTKEIVFIGRDITERQRAQRRQILQYVTTLILADSPTIEKAIAELLPVICDTLGWDVGELWMTEEGEKLMFSRTHTCAFCDPHLLRCVASWSQDSVYFDEFIKYTEKIAVPPGIGLVGSVWNKGACEWINEVIEDENFTRAEIAAQVGLHASFAFPILGDYDEITARRSVLGVMTFLSRFPQSHDEDLLQTMAALGSQMGQFIKRKQAEEAIRVEQAKSERLLLNILPSAIADRLKQDESTIAEYFPHATVLFADLVGFTPLSASMSPIALVNLLNQIFSAFDRLSEKHGLEKIKTIGDAYMVVGGIPTQKDDHAHAIALMALDMQKAVAEFNIKNNKDFSIRIGIHSGPVVAGVIGIKKFIYDLWGDTVNIASRMESHSFPGQIQMSDATYQIIKDNFTVEERGSILVKGRGQMTTYFLLGKKANNVVNPWEKSWQPSDTQQMLTIAPILKIAD